MEYIDITFKLIVSISIFWVWLVRKNQPTAYRGGGAQSLQAEFARMGLSKTFMNIVGFNQCGFALMLLVSIVLREVEIIAIAGTAVYLTAALIMHLKIKDPASIYFPALLFLSMTLICLFI